MSENRNTLADDSAGGDYNPVNGFDSTVQQGPRLVTDNDPQPAAGTRNMSSNDMVGLIDAQQALIMGHHKYFHDGDALALLRCQNNLILAQNEVLHNLGVYGNG